MNRIINPKFNIKGKRFNKLTALSYAGSSGNGRMWRCQCDCGLERVVLYNDLNRNHITSCGKCRKQSDKRVSHKLSHIPEYKIWASMKHRCSNRNTYWSATYYSDRGISVCDRWKEFENFYEDMGSRPGPNYELDRIDNDKGYNPTNCQWITKQDNLRKREQVTKVSINNREYTLKEISKEYNLTYQSVYQRYLKGLRGEELIRPQDNRGRKRKEKRVNIFWFLSPIPLEVPS